MDLRIESSQKLISFIVDADEIYNLPLFECYLVVDCRSNEQYDECHIASALNFPPPCNSTTEQEKIQNLQNFVEYASHAYSNERWDPLILYGDNESQEHIHEFSRIIENFKQQPFPADPASKKYSPGDIFFRNILDRTGSIWILRGGFENFQEMYPILCVPSPQYRLESKDAVSTSVDVTGAGQMVSLPYHISRDGNGVFLSSRAVQWSSSLLLNMRVGAMLLDRQTFEAYAPFLTECSTETLICDHKDVDTSRRHHDEHKAPFSVFDMFDVSSKFIQDMIDSNNRVVVHLHGRSRSASVIIAWLMRYKDVTFDEAKDILKANTAKMCSSLTSVIDERLLLEKELRSWGGGQKKLGFNATSVAG